MIDLSLCNCSECPLGVDGPKPVVPDREEGHKDVVFVGIGPARSEIRDREFFTGPSGKLARRAAEALEYDSCEYTNCLLCYYSSEMSDSDVRRAAQCCKPRLAAEIESYSPRLIVAYGNLALRTITDKDYGITNVDGRVLHSPMGDVLAIQHPAAVLRRTDTFIDFVESLKSGIRFLEGRYQQITLEPRVVVANEDNISDICQAFANAKDLVIDLETGGKGFYPYGRDRDKIRCIVAAVDDETGYIIPCYPSPYYEAKHPNFINHEGLRKVLAEKPGIYHNGQFDCGFLWQEGIKTEIAFDTFLAHYMLDERTYAHGLKPLSAKLLGAPSWEDELKEYLPSKKSSYDLIPDDVLFKYAAFDVLCTYQLKQIFEPQLSDCGVFYDLIMPSTNMFVDLRHTGMAIDIGVMMEADEILEVDLNTAMDELNEMVGYYVNPLSPKEMAEVLYDDLKMPILKRFGRSTSADALKNLPSNPILDKIISIRELAQLRSTYVISLAGYVDYEYRIHPFLKLFATVTGRIAAEDPSVLNVVKNAQIKRMYLPEPGHWLVDMDQKQMELRWYVIQTGDDHLKDMLLSGDPHGIISDKILELTGVEWERDKVKAGVFGYIYKRGVESFMAGLRMDKQSALNLMHSIGTMVPSLDRYHKSIDKQLKENGYITSHFGRKRRFGLVTMENKHEVIRQAVNFPIQSAASDTNLHCMLHMYREGHKWGARPYWPVHDSVVLDLEDKSALLEVKNEMERFSKELVDGKMDFTVEAKIGKNWGDMLDACSNCGSEIEEGKKAKVKGVTHCQKCADRLN